MNSLGLNNLQLCIFDWCRWTNISKQQYVATEIDITKCRDVDSSTWYTAKLLISTGESNFFEIQA